MKAIGKVLAIAVLLAAPSVFAGGGGGSSSGSGGSRSNSPSNFGNPSHANYERTVDKYRDWGFSEENARREAAREISRGGNSGIFDGKGNRADRNSTGRGATGRSEFNGGR